MLSLARARTGAPAAPLTRARRAAPPPHTHTQAFKPNERIRSLNMMGSTFGDERAALAREQWDKPLRSIVIRNCGLVANPDAREEEGPAE